MRAVFIRHSKHLSYHMNNIFIGTSGSLKYRNICDIKASE